MPFEPIARRSVSDAVFEQLHAQIVGGALAPGEPLPSERRLTELFGVNRQALREALKRLDQAGLVEIVHGGATRVLDFRRSGGLDLLPSLLLRPDGSLDASAARSVMEMRNVIGPDAARRCAERAIDPLPAQLSSVVDAMAAAGDDLPTLGALDWRFWDLVIEGSDNIAYRLAFNSLRAGAEPMGPVLELVLQDELRDLDGHRALAAAVGQADAEAAEAAARQVLGRGATRAAELLAGLDRDGEP